MFKVNYYSKLIGLMILAMSTSVYSATETKNKTSPIYVGSSDSRVNIVLSQKGDSAITLLLKKANDFKRIGRKDQSALIWERILKSDPHNQQSLAELASYHYQLKDLAGTRKLLDALAKVNSTHPAVGEINLLLNGAREGDDRVSEESFHNDMVRREKDLLAKAAEFEKLGNYSAAVEVYRKIQWLNPNNPWATFGLAHDLLKLGNKRGAEFEIEQIGLDVVDGNHVYALFYAEISDWEKVVKHINNINSKAMNADIEHLKTRANLHIGLITANKLINNRESKQAAQLLNEIEVTLDSQRVFDSEFSAKICDEWVRLGQSDRAIAYLEKRHPLDEGLHIYWISLLLNANQDERLMSELSKLDNNSTYNFSAHQQKELDDYRVIVGLRLLDAYLQDGNMQEAIVLIRQLYSRFPTNQEVVDAKTITERLALNFAVEDAEQLLFQDKIEEAQELVISKLAETPNEPKLIEEEKRIKFFKATRIEKGIAQGQKYIDKDQIYEAGSLITQLYRRFPDDESLIAENARVQKLVAKKDATMTSVAEMELAKKRSLEVLGKSPSGKQAAAFYEVNSEGVVQHSYVDAGYSFLQRSGNEGLNKMVERDIPVALHIPFKSHDAEFIIKADNVSLDSGNVTASIDRFGYGNAVRHGSYVPIGGSYLVDAQGTSLSVGYKFPGLSADIGISPAGFLIQNWVWGLRAEADYKSTSLSIETTRRSVSDSVISFAGAREPYGGGVWGGVVKTGVQVAAYRSVAKKLGAYASYGEYDYTGLNVANNHSAHLTGSLIYGLRDSEASKLTLAFAISETGYKNNQNTYTWGNGGYYSPQEVISINLPLHLEGKSGPLTYDASLFVGRSRTVEGSPITYPTEAVWQTNFGAAQYGTTIFANTYGFDWSLEYKLTPSVVVGNTLRVSNNDTTYRYSSAMAYFRFDLDHINARVNNTPKPIKPYYQTLEGGAAHN